MWNIRIDAATAEVVAALKAAGIPSVVLKGPALSDWNPPVHASAYADGDLWVSPRDEARAGDVLSALGFQPEIDERGLPAWWSEHASNWHRDADRGSIDLHRKLQGVRADPALTWQRLSAECEEFTLAGRTALRLSSPGRALYVALHSAHDGLRGMNSLAHLEGALNNAGEETWRAAAGLAEDLDAIDAFSAGLRLTASGRTIADALGLRANRSIEVAIRTAGAPPVALGFEQLASARARMRALIAVRKAFPPAGFIRHWWTPAARGPGWLLIGYAYRPLWLLQKAPEGLRAYMAARRATQGR